jgi:Protein of unknown function (DUF3037)
VLPSRDSFEYALIRVVPRVERGECLNAGVVLFCRPRRYLDARTVYDEARLFALVPDLDESELAAIREQLALIPRIATGDPTAGPIARLSIPQRWHWLVAPASTVIQPGPVHTGLTDDPAEALDHLFKTMVETSRGRTDEPRVKTRG